MPPKSRNRRQPGKPKRIRRRSQYTVVSLLALTGVAICGAVFARPQAAETQTKLLAAPVDLADSSSFILVPAPARRVAKGERLDMVPMTTHRLPRDRHRENFVLDQKALAGLIAVDTLPEMLPIPASSVSQGSVDTSNAVVEGIPDGMRAIAVKVDAESAVEGWARSGNAVDVILLKSVADSGLEAKVIAENVRILSVNRSTETADGRGASSAAQAPATVTLLTSQEDSLKIKTAASIGKLTFALRGTKDSAPAIATSLNQRELLGGARTVAVPKGTSFSGFAQGPDGETYALEGDRRWIAADETISAFPKRAKTKKK